MTVHKKDFYEKMTNAIIEKMEAGHIPWEKDWTVMGAPRNRISKRAYSGINFIILSMSPYECDQWLTYKQAKEMGGSVKKGERGTDIVFYKQVNKEDNAGKKSKYSLLKSYTVFNVEQCEGIEPLPIEANQLCGPRAYSHHIQRIIERHDITVIYGNPAYNSTRDYVRLPTIEEFDSEVGYCQAATHEFVHWTGHSSRHDRFDSFDETLSTSNELYAAEELVAELGAAMICSSIGIRAINTHAAYLQSWLKQLKNDKKYIFQAAAKAKKAVDLLADDQLDSMVEAA